MRLVVHQPHFLPWLGYLNKISNADCFVMQDDVQFRRRYFQNRTLVRDNACGVRWLTLPVHARRNTLIKEVKVVEPDWQVWLAKRLSTFYGDSEYFSPIMCSLEKELKFCNNHLIEINHRLLLWIFDLLDIDVEIRRSSDFQQKDTPRETIINIATKIGASSYVFGEGGGLKYIGKKTLQEHGIRTTQQEFRKKWNENLPKFFVPCDNLSVLDFLFHLGITETKKIVKETWRSDCYQTVGSNVLEYPTQLSGLSDLSKHDVDGYEYDRLKHGDKKRKVG